MIRIAAIARRIFKNMRLAVLPEAAIEVFVENRRIVVFDNRDDVAVVDVLHPKVAELCDAVKPTGKNPDFAAPIEPDFNEQSGEQSDRDRSSDDHDDAPGW